MLSKINFVTVSLVAKPVERIFVEQSNWKWLMEQTC